jgi:hypothetical protein
VEVDVPLIIMVHADAAADRGGRCERADIMVRHVGA